MPTTVHWKHRIFAALLGIVMPGLGQLYGGQQKKGLWVYALVQVGLPFSFLAVWGVAPAGAVYPLLLGLAAATLALWVWSLGDAALQVDPESEQAFFVGTGKQQLTKVALALVLIAGMLLNPFEQVWTNRVAKFVMGSASMAPVLQKDDSFFVNVQAFAVHAPQVGDIVTVRPMMGSEHAVVRQVAGLPGQVVVPVADTIMPEGLPRLAAGESFTLPQGFMYVRTVNPEFPFAAIMPVGLLQGRVEYIFWPPSRLGAVSGAGHMPVINQ